MDTNGNGYSDVYGGLELAVEHDSGRTRRAMQMDQTFGTPNSFGNGYRDRKSARSSGHSWRRNERSALLDKLARQDAKYLPPDQRDLKHKTRRELILNPPDENGTLGYSHLNDALENFGLEESDRTALLMGYGKSNVRTGLHFLQFYSGAITKETVVAAIDYLAREGVEKTYRALIGGINLREAVATHYEKFLPMPFEQDDAVIRRSHEAIGYLVTKYMWGMDVDPKSTFRFTSGDSATTSKISNFYTVDDILGIQARLNHHKLSAAKVINSLGDGAVILIGDDRLDILDNLVVNAADELGIPLHAFRELERIHPLSIKPLLNSSMTYVTLQEFKVPQRGLDPTKKADAKILLQGGYHKDEPISSHDFEHNFGRLNG